MPARNPLTKLTPKQQTVLECIQRYVAQHRCAPLIREIQQQCGILSYKSTIDRLNALERKGFIKRRPNKHRGISLPKVHPEAEAVDAAALARGAQAAQLSGSAS